MTSEKIIEDAKQNKEVPSNYGLLEMHLFLAIQQILKMYSNNQISKNEANRLKNKAKKLYESNIKQYEFKQKMFDEHIENIKNTQTQRIELRKLLNENKEITDERLASILDVCLDILNIVFKGEFI